MSRMPNKHVAKCCKHTRACDGLPEMLVAAIEVILTGMEVASWVAGMAGWELELRKNWD